mmetsp:Transcript_20849/g.46558  ORF Transcript_20849/g.46558 Transcript_20849/m.46558 type:complete len:265 (-) Transcript_20849:1446-2240(-)
MDRWVPRGICNQLHHVVVQLLLLIDRIRTSQNHDILLRLHNPNFGHIPRQLNGTKDGPHHWHGRHFIGGRTHLNTVPPQLHHAIQCGQNSNFVALLQPGSHSPTVSFDLLAPTIRHPVVRHQPYLLWLRGISGPIGGSGFVVGQSRWWQRRKSQQNSRLHALADLIQNRLHLNLKIAPVLVQGHRLIRGQKSVGNSVANCHFAFSNTLGALAAGVCKSERYHVLMIQPMVLDDPTNSGHRGEAQAPIIAILARQNQLLVQIEVS